MEFSPNSSRQTNVDDSSSRMLYSGASSNLRPDDGENVTSTPNTMASTRSAGRQGTDSETARTRQTTRTIEITPWSLLNTIVLLAAGISKAISSYRGNNTAATTLDLALGIFWALISYWISKLENERPDILSWFLETDLNEYGVLRHLWKLLRYSLYIYLSLVTWVTIRSVLDAVLRGSSLPSGALTVIGLATPLLTTGCVLLLMRGMNKTAVLSRSVSAVRRGCGWLARSALSDVWGSRERLAWFLTLVGYWAVLVACYPLAPSGGAMQLPVLIHRPPASLSEYIGVLRTAAAQAYMIVLGIVSTLCVAYIGLWSWRMARRILRRESMG